MEVTSSKIYVKQSLIDESFNSDKVNHYRLFIQLGNDFLSTCILDDVRKKFICLEDFHFPFAGNPETLAERCEITKQQSKLLMLDNFRSVNCCVRFPKATLVPEPLYDKRSEELFFDFNFNKGDEEIILTDDLKLIHAKNLFTIPSLIQKMLHYWFPDCGIHHYSTAFLNGLFISNRKEKSVTLNVHPEEFDMAVTEGSKLIFYNRFHYVTSEDFLYFILFTLEQLQLNDKTVDVKIAGDIDKHSLYYKSACKYLPNISFMEQLHTYKYSYKFEALPPAAHFTLFNQFLCE
jgi:hypothetical protein